MKTNDKVATAQGAEPTPAKGRKASSLYTLKSLKANIRKAETLKMATPEEIKQLETIHEKLTQRWIGGNLL